MTYSRRRFLGTSLLAAASVNPLRRAWSAPLKTSVIVVGAGLAGLVAALELQRASCRVLLLEASEGVGGRVRTLRSGWDDGLYAEAGASRISDVHSLVLKYAREFGLQLIPFRPEGLPSVLVAGGRRFGSEDDCRSILPGLNLKSLEQRCTPGGLLELYVGSSYGNGNGNGHGDWRLPENDQVTWPDWLRSRGASEDAIQLMTLGGDSHDLSAAYVLRQIALHRKSRGYSKIVGGMDELPRKMAVGLAKNIRYQARVVQIEQDARFARVTSIESGRVRVDQADRVVLATPLPLLKKIRAGLSEGKQRAMGAVQYFAATRSSFQTRSRFWRESQESGFARTDEPAEITDCSFGQSSLKGLLSVTTQNNSTLARAFPAAQQEIEKEVTVRWHEETWAKGAFATFRPGQMTAFGAELARREGRLHFAGEHTSIWSGWMEGAVESGLRAAREVLEGELA